ncbi:uncharacterized protein K452DRAFT_118533 [Aplosporella prunicola CBS 121167]|uniref:Uncharacterized protein n=1 Tax=Aplosporella prunicola CBS 121167 TaxID=1176127 RepID=A0A6A6BPF6_9PEZI|nr:uncharacterized protein K452DRAFT_118533 [Aplosporella prunicola CBS 121167]KAF2145333.1 hypothetical protein K452DRAFT_118533 [Aplosporella prunicola CBS 121167]
MTLCALTAARLSEAAKHLLCSSETRRRVIGTHARPAACPALCELRCLRWLLGCWGLHTWVWVCGLEISGWVGGCVGGGFGRWTLSQHHPPRLSKTTNEQTHHNNQSSTTNSRPHHHCLSTTRIPKAPRHQDQPLAFSPAHPPAPKHGTHTHEAQSAKQSVNCACGCDELVCLLVWLCVKSPKERHGNGRNWKEMKGEERQGNGRKRNVLRTPFAVVLVPCGVLLRRFVVLCAARWDARTACCALRGFAAFRYAQLRFDGLSYASMGSATLRWAQLRFAAQPPRFCHAISAMPDHVYTDPSIMKIVPRPTVRKA